MSLEKKSDKNTKQNNEELITTKPKRIMTEKQKENLAKGRLKAHERMRNIKADKEELAKYREQNKPLKSVDSDDEETPPPKEKTKPKKKPVMKSPDVSDEESDEEEIIKPIVKVNKGKRIIEKHYYHEPPKQIEIEKPPPPPAPAPVPTPAPVIKAKKKLNFR